MYDEVRIKPESIEQFRRAGDRAPNACSDEQGTIQGPAIAGHPNEPFVMVRFAPSGSHGAFHPNDLEDLHYRARVDWDAEVLAIHHGYRIGEHRILKAINDRFLITQREKAQSLWVYSHDYRDGDTFRLVGIEAAPDDLLISPVLKARTPTVIGGFNTETKLSPPERFRSVDHYCANR
jgi:hypothetical protein